MKERPCSSTSYQLNRCFVNVFGKKLRTGFCPAPRPGAFAIGVQSILQSVQAAGAFLFSVPLPVKECGWWHLLPLGADNQRLYTDSKRPGAGSRAEAGAKFPSKVGINPFCMHKL